MYKLLVSNDVYKDTLTFDTKLKLLEYLLDNGFKTVVSGVSWVRKRDSCVAVFLPEE